MNAASTTELDGATHRGPVNAYPANAGEFAARWNAKTEDERNGWVAFMVGEAMEAQRADRNAIEWARRVGELEAERDALRADNADLKEDEQEALEERNAALKQRDALRAERDALRAQLDGMTTEWGTLDQDDWSGDEGYRPAYDEAAARSRLKHGRLAVALAKRLVGPWVEVED